MYVPVLCSTNTCSQSHGKAAAQTVCPTQQSHMDAAAAAAAVVVGSRETLGLSHQLHSADLLPANAPAAKPVLCATHPAEIGTWL